MKIAGTLQTPKDLSLKKLETSSASVFADIDTGGMTAKQKKNLRKKLYRKRKKLEQSQNNSKLDLTANSIDEDESRENNGSAKADEELPDIDIDIDVKIDEKKQEPAAKKKAVTGSVERVEQDDLSSKLNDLIQDDNGQQSSEQAAPSSATGQDEGNTKRGPKIGDDVQVKICDMGNGCWTYHHFTPEI